MNPNNTMQSSVPVATDVLNTSGQGKAAQVPEEIKGWNWGAFGLNLFWGIGNSTYLAFLVLIPVFNIVWIFVLGAKGSEWAWKNRRWESIEKFKKVQRTWTIVWLCLLIAIVLLIAGLFIFVFSATSVPVKTADTFLNELSSNQVETAYDSINPSLKNTVTLDQFESYVNSNPILTEIKSVSFSGRSISTSDSGTKAVLGGTVVGEDGTTSPITVSEVEQNGVWQVVGINLNQQDATQ